MLIGIDARELQLNRMTDAKRLILNFVHDFNQSHYSDQCVLFSQQSLDVPLSDKVENCVLPSEFNFIWEHFWLSLAIKRYGVDVFYSPTPYLPLLTGVRKICCIDDVSSLKDSSGNRLMIPKFFSHADRMIVRTQLMKEYIMSEYEIPLGKVDVVPFTIDDVYYVEQSKESIKSFLSQQHIASPYVFQIISKQSINTIANVFKAFCLLAQKDDQMTFVLEVECLEDVAVIQKKAEEFSIKRAIILVKGDDDYRSKLYQGSYACVIDCQQEDFSVSLIEAMASGCVIVCSDQKSAPELMAGSGLVVDMTDANAIVKTIERISLDPFLRQDLINRTRIRSKDFDKRRLVNKMYDIFRHVCKV